MNGADPAVLDALLALVADARTESASRLAVIGLCGAQGSGKTTLARAAVQACNDEGVAAAILSIDDLYMTRLQRDRMAREVHPLFATRGPPGTHDLALGEQVIAALERGEATRLVRFDKARDDRSPESDWPRAPAHCQVLVLEGWCVGACAQRLDELAKPLNPLEAQLDPHGLWRHHVNAVLGSSYQAFFERIDRLAMLAAPSFDVIQAWRLQQEEELRASVSGDQHAVMNDAQIARFIQHYERLTRHMLAEMPARADLLVRLDAERRPVAITRLR